MHVHGNLLCTVHIYSAYLKTSLLFLCSTHIHSHSLLWLFLTDT